MRATCDLVDSLNQADTALIETIAKTRAVMEHLSAAQPDHQSIQTLCQEVVNGLEGVGSTYAEVCHALQESIPIQPRSAPSQ